MNTVDLEWLFVHVMGWLLITPFSIGDEREIKSAESLFMSLSSCDEDDKKLLVKQQEGFVGMSFRSFMQITKYKLFSCCCKFLF